MAAGESFKQRAAGETKRDKAALEEFKILRGEIELRGSEQRAMERYVIVADAFIYGLLVVPPREQVVQDKFLFQFLWFIPPMIGFLALIRWRESVKMIETLAEFLRRREAELFGDNGGWEWFLYREKRKCGQIGLFSVMYVVFWAILIAGTLALGVYKVLAPVGAVAPAWHGYS